MLLSVDINSFNKPPLEKKHAWISVVEWTINMSSRSSLAPSMPLLNGYSNTQTQNLKLTLSNNTVGQHSAGMKLSVLSKYLLKWGRQTMPRELSLASWHILPISQWLTELVQQTVCFIFFTYLLFLTSSFRDGKHCDIFENIKNSEKIIFVIYRAFAYTLQKI